MIKIRFTTKRSAPRRKTLIVWNVVLSVLISLGVSLPTAAITRAQLEFYAQNGIFFYNPDNTVGITDSMACVSGSNTNYAGAQVFDSGQMDLINANKFAYQAAADQYGFPWQVLAVIHSIESSLSRKNPANGDGLYQIIHSDWHDSTFTPNKVLDDDEFLATTIIAAKFIAENKASDLNLNTADGVKELFLRYNGTGGGHYKAKAEALGYSATYEGSPYVMNRFDAPRDPTNPSTMNPAWPGMYIGTTSGNSHYDPTYTWTGFGAYTKYVALGGSGDGGCFFYTFGGYTLGYGASGMTEDEAVKFMQIYRDRMHKDANGVPTDSDLKRDYGLTSTTCSEGIAYNCVSVSRYFVNMFTSRANNKITTSLGNGIDVASNLIGSYPLDFQACGPKAFSVFSGSGSGSEGHTGVILGINTVAPNAGEVITGEAGCNSGEDGIKVVVYPLTTFMEKYRTATRDVVIACPTQGVNLSADSNYTFRFPELIETKPIKVCKYDTNANADCK